MIYLVKTNTFSSSWLVVVSLLSSLWSIISKLVSDDKLIVIPEARKPAFKFSKIVLVDICVMILAVIAGVIGIALAVVAVALAIVCCPCILCGVAFYRSRSYDDEKQIERYLSGSKTKLKNKVNYKLEVCTNVS